MQGCERLIVQRYHAQAQNFQPTKNGDRNKKQTRNKEDVRKLWLYQPTSVYATTSVQIWNESHTGTDVIFF